MMRLRRADAVPDLAARWRELQGRSDIAFFLTWGWIGTWLRESGARPWLLEARQGDRLVALALLQPRPWRTVLLHQAGDAARDSIVIEHNDILLDRVDPDGVRQQCLDFLVGAEARAILPWEELLAAGVSATGPVRHAAASAGLTVADRALGLSRVIDLEAVRRTGRPFLDGLSANTRQQVRRAMRLYGERGTLALHRAATVEEALAFFDAMKELHQRYWTGRGKPGSFAQPFFERFHRALIAACFADGGVELACITAGEEPIGFLYNLVHDGWVCAYQSGFLYEADPRLKPGLVSHVLCVERHLAQGARRYDMLGGDSRYKGSLAGPGPAIATLALQRPVLRLRLANAARRLKATLGRGR